MHYHTWYTIVLISWLKKKHLSERTELNRDSDAPDFCTLYELSENEKETGWHLAAPIFNLFHDNQKGYPEIKFFHIDGREYIYKAKEKTCPPEYTFSYGSYNYCPFYSHQVGVKKYLELAHRALGHLVLDILPSLVFRDEKR